MLDAKSIIENISELPTLPDVVAKVNDLVSSSSASAGDINNVISRDVALSAKILKMVNSSFYGFPRRITSITHAVVILGFNTVRNLTLSAFVFNAFKDKKLFDQQAFWAHSIGVAVTATTIAQHLKIPQNEREDAFMAGLLHDVGKVVMCEFVTEEMEKVLKLTQEKDILFWEAENEILAFNHASLGEALLESWNLPLNIVRLVANHHQPLINEDTAKMTSLINIADILARSLCFGSGGDNKIPEIETEVWKNLGLDWDNVGKIMDQSLLEMQRANAFFELL